MNKTYELNAKEPLIVRGSHHELIDASGIEQVVKQPKLDDNGAQLFVDGQPAQENVHMALPRLVITYNDAADANPNTVRRFGTTDEKTLRKIRAAIDHALEAAESMKTEYAAAHAPEPEPASEEAAPAAATDEQPAE